MDADTVKQYILDTFDGINVMVNDDDTFVIYDPAGDLPPERQQPFATIVTGDRYDNVSHLDRPGAYRLNVGLTKVTYLALLGAPPTERDEQGILRTDVDYAAIDTLLPHPYYASQYWVAIVDPGARTWNRLRDLLAEAHAFAARKYANQQARQAERGTPATEA